jgi:large subunit ribosomal protein L29
MKASDLREKTVEDLRELHKTLARDVFQNRLKNFTNRLDDTSAMRKTRRDVARVATLLRERELGRGPDAAQPAKKAAPKAEVKAAAVEPKAEKATKKKSSAKANQKSEAK